MKLTKTQKYLASLIIALYVGIYFGYVYPLSRLHKLQTKEWAASIIENTVLGVKDESYLHKINQSKVESISFYYNWFLIHTKQCVIYIVVNLNNQYSNETTLSVYLYNFETKKRDLIQTLLNFNDLQTTKHGDELTISFNNSYIQKINMVTNKMTVEVHMSSMNLSFEFDIDDYTSILPTFLPRYDSVKSIVKPYNPVSSNPNEWCTYNPMMGKVIKGSMNQYIIEGGNFWHENLLGVNDFFLVSNYWYTIINDDWLIYNLWMGEYEDENKNYFFIVKHRKTNKVIRVGITGNAEPFPFKCINNMINPVKCKFTSTKTMGTQNYDSFSSYFETDEITIKIDSIPNECHRVFQYDYYASSNQLKNKKMDILNNYKYVEYVNMVNVEINYDGKKEVFKERCGIDSFFKIDKKMDETC